MRVKRVKYVKMSFFEFFSKLYIGMSSYRDEFLYVKIESLMFLEEFCTKNESISFDIHGILVPQILWVFLQKICGFMTFGMDFDLKVMLMERMVLGMWKGWCNLFSVYFVPNNSMFLTLYIEICENSHFYKISCVGFLTYLVNMCWLSVDQMMFFKKYDV